MTGQEKAASDKRVFRKTNTRWGRRMAVSPANSSMQHFAYSRILLDHTKSSESFQPGLVKRG
jgi:hypothetical protein